MHRTYLRALFALSLAVDAGLGLTHTARACETPAPAQTIGPPGSYNDAVGYAYDVKPMRDFIT